MSVPVLVRIFATLPEQPGAWPPLVLSCTNDQLVVDHGRAESLPSNAEGGSAGAVGVSPPPDAVGHEADPAADHGEEHLWSIEGQQWLTPKQLGRARWAFANLSSPGPIGLVPRSTSSETAMLGGASGRTTRSSAAETLDMIGHSDLTRVLSSVCDLPYAGVIPMDGIAVVRSTKECPTVQLPEGAGQVLIIPLCRLQQPWALFSELSPPSGHSQG